MNEHQELAILALHELRGDDLRRARAAFRDCTPEQMNGLYGQSGLTRNAILRGYEEHSARCDAAIKWVRSAK